MLVLAHLVYTVYGRGDAPLPSASLRSKGLASSKKGYLPHFQNVCSFRLLCRYLTQSFLVCVQHSDMHLIQVTDV